MVLVDLEYIIERNSGPILTECFDSISYYDLNYSDFFRKYLFANKPCVVRGVTQSWKCQSEWVKDKCPNFDFLTSKFGHNEIPTANCNEKYYNSHTKGCWKFSEYMNYWKDYISSGYLESMPCLYLKDWHCFKENPEDEWYEVPEYFASDWLNEYYLSYPELNDDYRFVYMGPKGTWTPLHKDVFSSFSWSVNLCGEKTWLFYPPDQVDYLSDKLGNLAFDVKGDKNENNFPRLSEAKSYRLHQGQGDAVFVPSGWYHQVWNEENTISVNHNWVNGCNIEHMLLNLLSELRNVEKELSDCQDSPDWESDCQRLLKATFGLDIAHFIQLVSFIVKRRISSLESKSNLELPSGHLMGPNHLRFDLTMVQGVLKTLLNLSYTCVSKLDISEILENINKVLDSG